MFGSIMIPLKNPQMDIMSSILCDAMNYANE